MFNLSKQAFLLDNAPTEVLEDTEGLTDNLRDDLNNTNNPDAAVQPKPNVDDNVLDPNEKIMSDVYASISALEAMNQLIDEYPPEMRGLLEATAAYQEAQRATANFDPSSYGYDEENPDDASRLATIQELARSNPKFNNTVTKFRGELDQLSNYQNQQMQMDQQMRGVGVFGFNLRRWKTAQSSIFPVNGITDFMDKFLDRLTSTDPEVYVTAVNEILSVLEEDAVEQEVKSMLESLLGEKDQGKAACIMGSVYKFLPDVLKTEENEQAQQPTAPSMPQQMPMENPVMSETNPRGIIKFNLSDHVLNNKSAENAVGFTKTAADHFGQEYMLYGPTEKRICPKLRGKGGGQPGSGDVVSEYICRHHCLDGIVIDDNKTICGEALWRANSMDKQSREYVDADGNIKGGYIEKRFNVEHNVPEENKMRLKPGETRKPRPAAWGNLESRMQDMRKKEADKRGYRPDSNTGDTFNWCSDPDQNNVEQTQSERDRREKAMGHQTVEYTNKTKQENNPKVASGFFNLKGFKIASEAKVAKCDCGKDKCDCCNNPADTGEAYSTMLNRRFNSKKKAFNLKEVKTAQGAGIPLPQDGSHLDRFHEDPKRRPKSMRSLGLDEPEVDQSLNLDPVNPPESNEPDNEPVTTPSGQVADNEVLQEENLQDLSVEILKYDQGNNGAIFSVSNTWATGRDADPEMVAAAYKELEQAINPENAAAPISEEMIHDVRELQAKLQPLMSEKEMPKQMPMNMPRQAKSPPGFKGTVEKMKEDHGDEIDNPFALAWWMKNKGYKSHYKSDGSKKDDAEKQAQVNPQQQVTGNPAATNLQVTQRPNEDQVSNDVERGLDQMKRQIKTKKPMEMQKGLDHPVILRLVKSPECSGLFEDSDSANDFFDSLSADEMRIIVDSKDPKVLLEVKQKVDGDLNETAKQLAMDD